MPLSLSHTAARPAHGVIPYDAQVDSFIAAGFPRIPRLSVDFRTTSDSAEEVESLETERLSLVIEDCLP